MPLLVRFLVSHAASAFATGVHVVMMAWIGLQELHLSPLLWGVVQGAALLPNLLLMLVAGAWADRYNPARVLAAAQCLLSVSYLGLLVMVQSGEGSFITLVAYAVVIGVGNAFVQPVREKLVADLPDVPLQRRVSLLSITQFSLQGADMGLAALSDHVGIVLVLGVQAGVSCFSALVFASLVSRTSSPKRAVVSTAQGIGSALRAVMQSPGLRQLMTLIAFNGYMHLGVFLVVIPVVATRVYQLNAHEYAGLQALFVAGMVSAHFLLLRQKTVEFPGQGALFSLLYTALVGFGLAKEPTPMGFYFLVFMWGVVAGNSASRCRLVAQSLAAVEMRGRVMSVYQLMLFGAAPIGAMVTGIVLKVLSFQQIFYVMSASSVMLFVLFMFSRSLWAVRQAESFTESDSEKQ